MCMVVCGWHGGADWSLDMSTGPAFLSESSLDLKGTVASWLILGMAVPSWSDVRLSLLENSTTAYVPWKAKHEHSDSTVSYLSQPFQHVFYVFTYF